jgi:hypothetical protein
MHTHAQGCMNVSVCVCVCVCEKFIVESNFYHTPNTCTHIHTKSFQHTQTQTYRGHWIMWRHWIVHSKFFVFGSSLIAPPLFGLTLQFKVLNMCFKLMACCFYYLLIGSSSSPATRPRPLALAIAPSFCCCPSTQCPGLMVADS